MLEVIGYIVAYLLFLIVCVGIGRFILPLPIIFIANTFFGQKLTLFPGEKDNDNG